MQTGRCVRCPRTNSAPLLGSRLMGKRRADADGRRFFDEFLCVKENPSPARDELMLSKSRPTA
jgi:hypothetical protein